MSLVEEVLALHEEDTEYARCACCWEVWPCKYFRLATELQNAQASVEAARKDEPLFSDKDADAIRRQIEEIISEPHRTTPEVRDTLVDYIQDVVREWLLARYDEGRKA